MSFPVELSTSQDGIRLIAPDIDRDSALGVKWLQGESGKLTMRMMGNAAGDITAPDEENEKERVKGFIDGKDQYNWMIEVDGAVVGTVWADLQPKDSLPAPAIHIMIGDSVARNKGVGYSASKAVVEYLFGYCDFEKVYSRHLTANEHAGKLLESSGFKKFEDEYTDKDGLRWQNVVLEKKND